jgi:hypothetical protein
VKAVLRLAFPADYLAAAVQQDRDHRHPEHRPQRLTLLLFEKRASGAVQREDGAGGGHSFAGHRGQFPKRACERGTPLLRSRGGSELQRGIERMP